MIRRLHLLSIASILVFVAAGSAASQNQPPQISNCPIEIIIDHCGVGVYEFQTTDFENDVRWLELVDGPGTVDSARAIWTFAPWLVHCGQDISITVRVCDEFGCGTECVVPILVTNQAPVFTHGCNDTLVGENWEVLATGFTITDDICDAHYYYLLTSDPAATGTASIHPFFGEFEYVPTPADAGKYLEFEVGVTDSVDSTTCSLWVYVLAGQNAPSVLGDCGTEYVATVGSPVQAWFRFSDFDYGDTHDWSVINTSAVTGDLIIADGRFQYTASTADLSLPQPVEFGIVVRDQADLADTCQFFASVVASGNNPPQMICNYNQTFVQVGTTAAVRLAGRDPDVLDPHIFSVLSYAGSGTAWTSQDTLYYSPAFGDTGLSQPVTIEIEMGDGAGALDTCPVYFDVSANAPVVIEIERSLNNIPNNFVSIDVMVRELHESAMPWLDSLELLIGYDTAYLEFIEPPHIGDEAYQDCYWEYFNYAQVTDCIGNCPPGLLRIVMKSEIDDGPYHPVCIPAAPFNLFSLIFNFTEEPSFTDSMLPLQFFWRDCRDNVISYRQPGAVWGDPSAGGITSRVMDHRDAVSPVEITDLGSLFPTYFGAPSACDLDYTAHRMVDFHSILPDDWYIRPVAVIDSISPNPSLSGEPVYFGGRSFHRSLPDAVIQYEWRSSRDGLLGSDSAFVVSALSDGIHKIMFRVQDSESLWSGYYIDYLAVGGTGGCCIGLAGDISGDGIDADPVDLSYLVDFLFGGGDPPSCPEEADLNADSITGDPVDLSYLVDFLFSSGAPPEPCL